MKLKRDHIILKAELNIAYNRIKYKSESWEFVSDRNYKSVELYIDYNCTIC